MRRRNARIGLAVVLALSLLTGASVAMRTFSAGLRTHVVAYFDNSNGLFRGDEVRILGVAVGAIDRIEPQPNRVKITFWVDNKYRVPANVKAAILSPQLVTARAIQLTPPYTDGPVMTDGAVIPQSRTAVPVEWDDLRLQLDRLTDALQPTQPGGVSTLGAFINTAADNLRGQGMNIRNTVVKLSQALSVLGDHSDDTFSTMKNLSVMVAALHDSSDLLRQLNTNLATVTALLANDPGEVGQAIRDLTAVVTDTRDFIADNREALGTTTDKLASVSTAVRDSLEDIRQTLHIAPNALQNLLNIYQPAQSTTTGALVVNNFANPIDFICGAVQAASRLGAEQSAKLCVQYLAPIVKNRQYNFPPLGENLFVGASARPNEITYTEDWMRPDHVPPQAPPPSADPPPGTPPLNTPLAAEAAPSSADPSEREPTPTDPSTGLPGMMAPPRTDS